MDTMLSETTKANGVPGAIGQGAPISGTQNAPVHIDNDITPPTDTEDERASRATQLLSVRRQVNMKRQRTANTDMSNVLDRFAESSTRIERMKMETVIQLHAGNKKLELKILQATQAS
jgi:hypothetical protein